MATPESDMDDAPPKRMRLGTKSCAECRRRKVRCVYPEDARACENCTLHEVPCKAQQPQEKERRKSARRDEEKEALQQRIDQLEEIVRQIAGTVGIDGASPVRAGWAPVGTSQGAGIDVTGRQTHGFLTPESSSAATYGQQQYSPFLERQTSTTTSLLDSADFLSSDDSDDIEAEHLDDGPLISLFKDVLQIQKPDSEDRQASSDVPGKAKMCKPVRNLSHLIPKAEDLKAVLDITQQYWFTWAPSYNSVSPPALIQAAGTSECLHFISTALTGSNPALAAKALLWLALCIAQLHLSSPLRSSLPATPQKLIKAYVSASKELLSDADERGPNLDSLEAWNLLFKIQLDRGQPRKAWLAIRHTLDMALVLGIWLPASSSTRAPDETRRRGLWTSIWTADRHISLTLGLPGGISNAHPGITQDLADPNDPVFLGRRFLRTLMILAGNISERDQLRNSAGYSTTVQLDQEWENIRSLLPAPFWAPEPPPGLGLQELYFRQMMQIAYYVSGKHIHLPYMLRALTDKKFEPSRQTCLEASRGLIRAYHGLRHGLDETQIVFCETMDFQAFSGAVVVVIDALARKSREGTSVAYEEDLLLVEYFAGSLARTAAAMECSVAGRGARLLQLLVAISRGTYAGPRDAVDVHIPYIGRVRIGFPRAQPAPSPSSSSLLSVPMTSPDVGISGTHAISTPTAVTFSNPSIVEFGADPWNFNFPFEFDLNAELSADWSALMDFDPSLYGWADSFDLDQVGPG